MAAAKNIFCFTARIVALEIRIALIILDGSSSINMISAASSAASAPRPPMANTLSTSTAPTSMEPTWMEVTVMMGIMAFFSA